MPGFVKTLLGLLAAMIFLALAPAFAQDVTGTTPKTFDFEAWESTASRAEEIIQNAEASSPALETMRATLARYRSQALTVQDANKARIDTLVSQLAALGPAPTEGAIEAAEVADRRLKLTEQLALARAPVLAAQEAYKRADGMIGEIDRIIRERLSDQFFTLGPSPLNLTLWPGALDALVSFFTDIQVEISTALQSDAQRVMIRQNMPITLALLMVGLILMTRARRWVMAALGLMPSANNATEKEARSLLASTMQVVFPMLGLAAILQAIESTKLVGLRGDVLLSAVLWMGLAIIGTLWLGRTLFTDIDGTPKFFDLSDKRARQGKQISVSMGVTLALGLLLDRMAAQADFSDASQIVVNFPIVLTGGLLLVRMGLLLDPKNLIVVEGHEVNPLQKRISGLVTRGAVVLGALGPVLAAIGYFTASTSFVYPAILTLGLFGTIIVVYRILTDLAETLLRSAKGGDKKPEDQPPTLIPVALGFGLLLISIPLLTLIWGARVSDLLEVWTLVSDGFTIGERRSSLTDFLTFALVFALGYTLTRLLQSTLRSTVLPRTKLDAGGRNAILTGTGYVGLFLAALAAITSAGLDLSSLAIVAGALSVGIGFGLQAIVSNFVSGIILLVERPIKEGDWIEVGAYSGYVNKISVRSTEIETFDRATVVVPNADFITGTVTNWTHGSLNGRVRVPVGVSYDSDPERVKQILTEIGSAHAMVDHRFNVVVYFMGFGADSLNFELRVILKDVNWMLSVTSDINYEIVRRFREEGIEIPYAQRDINLRNLGELGETIQKAMEPKK
jgi:small-conductance mechanosensitive channel